MTGGLGPFTTIAVDWNGTIVDDADRAWRATTTALQGLDLGRCDPGSVDGFRTSFKLPMEAFFAGLGVPVHLIDASVRRWNDAMLTRSTGLAPGAEHLLRESRAAGVPVVVISGAHEDVIRQDCEALGIAELIDRIHGSVHPKRDILRRYARRGPIVYIGDTRYDVDEGRAVGATTIAVDFGYGAADGFAGATAIVSDLSDVLSLLRRQA